MLRVIPFLCCMCASYAAADDCNKLSTTDSPTGSIEEFKAELIGSTSNAEAFKDVWTKYTFHVGPGRQNPLFICCLDTKRSRWDSHFGPSQI